MLRPILRTHRLCGGDRVIPRRNATVLPTPPPGQTLHRPPPPPIPTHYPTPPTSNRGQRIVNNLNSTSTTSPRHLQVLAVLLAATSLSYLAYTTSPPTLTEAPTPAPTPGVSVPITLGSTVDLIPSGTTSVPPFPRVLRARSGEYALIGLGIRTVSFLSIEVYVVGLYVHVDDLPRMKRALVREAVGAGMATAGASELTAEEKGVLRELLADPVNGEEVWARVLLAEGEGVRSCFRVVPTRNTDFQHLRDGWVRGIQQRSTSSSPSATEYDDEAFVNALTKFKVLFGGKFKRSVPKQKTLLLMRGADGGFSVFYDPTGRNDGQLGGEWEGNKKVTVEDKEVQKLGEIADPRIAKALWLCYLAGKKVASEPARKNIIDGVCELAGRPAGTLGTMHLSLGGSECYTRLLGLEHVKNMTQEAAIQDGRP